MQKYLNEGDLRRGIDNTRSSEQTKLEISAELKEHTRMIRERFLDAQNKIQKNLEASKKIKKGKTKGKQAATVIAPKQRKIENGKINMEDLISWEKRRKETSV